MAICSERPSAVLWKRISPSVPPAAGLGAAEQPPAALTQVLCICSWPSVVSAIARPEVRRAEADGQCRRGRIGCVRWRLEREGRRIGDAQFPLTIILRAQVGPGI